jgi:hypothetical protein
MAFMNVTLQPADEEATRAPSAVPEALSEAMDCVDGLFHVLRTDGHIPGAWGRLLDIEIDRASTQLQILRMTILLGRAGWQKLEAARALDGTLRHLNLRASKSRLPTRHRSALALAAQQARIALQELERSEDATT